LLSIPQASAQTAPAPNDAAPSQEAAPAEAGTLEQVTVTAQKRKQFAQAAPVAITAISGESLVKAGVTTSNQIADLTSGLKISGRAPRINVPTMGPQSVPIPPSTSMERNPTDTGNEK